MIELDGTDNKSKLGANGILAVSLAVARVREGLGLHGGCLGARMGRRRAPPHGCGWMLAITLAEVFVAALFLTSRAARVAMFRVIWLSLLRCCPSPDRPTCRRAPPRRACLCTSTSPTWRATAS